MSFAYENQGGSTFLVYAVEEGEQLDSMSAGMIINNRIPGLLKAVFTQTGANRSVRYPVSSKIPVKQYFSAPVSRKRLLAVFRSVLDAVLSAEEYMIGPDMLVLDTEYMFADAATGETELICLPVIREDPGRSDLGAFFKHVMFTAQFDQTEDRGYAAKIINYLNGGSAFSPEQFQDLLAELGTADKSAPAGPGNAEYPPVPPPPAAPNTPWAVSAAPAAPGMTAPPPPAQGFSAFPMGGQQTQGPGGMASFPGNSQWDPGTVILEQEPSARQSAPYLLRKRGGEKIPLTKPIFRVGRDIELNDYAVTDNVYVGHSHCHIVFRDGAYFVVDDNSKNRTSVNGAAAPPGREVRLTHGCKLSVANEEFEFRLY